MHLCKWLSLFVKSPGSRIPDTLPAHVLPGWGWLILMYYAVSRHQDPFSLEKNQWQHALATYCRHGNMSLKKSAISRLCARMTESDLLLWDQVRHECRRTPVVCLAVLAKSLGCTYRSASVFNRRCSSVPYQYALYTVRQKKGTNFLLYASV